MTAQIRYGEIKIFKKVYGKNMYEGKQNNEKAIKHRKE